MNQTFSINDLYNCGIREGKNYHKEIFPPYQGGYEVFLVATPPPSPETFTCGSKGYTNGSYSMRDFYVCGFFEGRGAITSAGAHSPAASHSLVKIMVFLMLITYAIVWVYHTNGNEEWNVLVVKLFVTTMALNSCDFGILDIASRIIDNITLEKGL